MARGQPDFGMYAAKEAGAAISDLGELAARIGSIVTYDKRGDVIDFDNFEEPLLRWQVTGYGLSYYARLDSDSARSASQSVKLHSPDLSAGTASIFKGFPVVGVRRMGVEISFSQLATDVDFTLWLIYYDGTHSHSAAAKIDPSAKKLYVFTTGNVYLEVADISTLFSYKSLYHTVKLVVDFTTDLYKRILLNLTEYDIATTALRALSYESAPYIWVQIGIWNRASVGGDVWIDDFIITQAEP